MTISNSYNYSRNASQVIQFALRKIGILAEGESASAEQIQDGLEDLNLMLKTWRADGINLFAYQEATLFINPGTESYQLGATGNHATASYVQTTLNAAAEATDTTITVSSITGISDGDYIGVVLDNNTIQWTTVNGTPSGNTVALDDAITGDAAIGKYVFAYTTKIQRPLAITSARYVTKDNQVIPMYQLARNDYFDLTLKSGLGTPTQYYYNPTLTNGTFYVWQTGQDPSNVIKLTLQRPLSDIDSISNTFEFPQEWIKVIGYNLAADIMDDYSVPDSTYQRIATKALNLYERVFDNDDDKAPLQFTLGDRL